MPTPQAYHAFLVTMGDAKFVLIPVAPADFLNQDRLLQIGLHFVYRRRLPIVFTVPSKNGKPRFWSGDKKLARRLQRLKFSIGLAVLKI